MRLKTLLSLAALSATLAFTATAVCAETKDLKVGITPTMKMFEGTIDGKKITIMRNQNTKNTVRPAYARTSRPCPPFCIQPMRLAPGVETIGELEVIDYLKKMAAGDKGIILIDSRTPDWVIRGTIPGAVNIPWTRLNASRGADPITIAEILTGRFGASETDVDEKFDFSNAKTLVMFCNGMWCGQSPANIRTLLKLGYPADRIKWYRGGMQDWEILGLSIATP